MFFKVFIDTNIYDASNYSFRNALFQEVRNKADKDELRVAINAVVEGEVRSHISDRVTKAVEKLNKALNDSTFAGVKKIPQFEAMFAQKDAQDIVNASLDEFESFLSDCKADRLSVENISISKVLQDYFEQNLPFETKKPDEFKDAIAVESLLLDMHKNLSTDGEDTGADAFQYCVVSNDTGFCGAVKNGLSEVELESVKFFPELIQFIDYLAGIDMQSEYLKRYLCSEYGAEMLEDTIKEAVSNARLVITLDGLDYVEEQDIIETEISSTSVYILGIYEFEDGPAIAKVAVKADVLIKVWYKYFDEGNSYWDKEDHEYLWKETGEVEASYQIEPEIVFSLDISRCIAPKNWEPESESDFSENEIEFNDYVEMPEVIECDENNFLDAEILEHSEPFCEYEVEDEVYHDVATNTCPDCGCSIGLQNDGGNGFCINCASKH